MQELKDLQKQLKAAIQSGASRNQIGSLMIKIGDLETPIDNDNPLTSEPSK
jgi:hypothetical protein